MTVAGIGSTSGVARKRRYKWHHILVSTLCICALVGVVASLFTTINSIHNMKRKKKRSTLLVDPEPSFVGDVLQTSDEKKISIQRRSTDDNVDGDDDNDEQITQNPSVVTNSNSSSVAEGAKKKRSTTDYSNKPVSKNVGATVPKKHAKITTNSASSFTNETDPISNDQGGAFNVMEMNINEQPKNLTASNRTIDEGLPGIARNTSTVEATLLAHNSTTKLNATTAEDVESEFASGDVTDSDNDDEGAASGGNSDQVSLEKVSFRLIAFITNAKDEYQRYFLYLVISLDFKGLN